MEIIIKTLGSNKLSVSTGADGLLWVTVGTGDNNSSIPLTNREIRQLKESLDLLREYTVDSPAIRITSTPRHSELGSINSVSPGTARISDYSAEFNPDAILTTTPSTGSQVIYSSTTANTQISTL